MHDKEILGLPPGDRFNTLPLARPTAFSSLHRLVHLELLPAAAAAATTGQGRRFRRPPRILEEGVENTTFRLLPDTV